MINDQLLEEKLLKLIYKLELKVDWVAPTPLRRKLNKHIVAMRAALRDFDQDAYESDDDWYSRPENQHWLE